ncbi:MAG: hypothetical protein ACRD01_14570 [Terriglobales bacterium]
MGFSTRVQCIKRKQSEQWYVNIPSALAQAMEFARSETVEWLVEAKNLLALRRPEAPPPVLKKTSSGSSATSSSSGKGVAAAASAASRGARRHSP